MHSAIYISNKDDKPQLIEHLINGNSIANVSNLKGAVFSEITLNKFIEEEIIHGQFNVQTDTNNSLLHSSEGERKKALLHHLISQKPEYLIIDNVFGNLDVAKQADIQKMLTDLSRSVQIIQITNRIAEILPFIDKTYSTRKEKENTFIAGSSMGGLISMYAMCEYPEVFGGAACLSTHWPGTFEIENNPIPNAFINYLKTNLPDSKSHKFYFDFGTGTLDAMYPPLQAKVDEVMQTKGYTNNNWITQKIEGAEHSENAWRVRLHIPFEFLLKK